MMNLEIKNSIDVIANLTDTLCRVSNGCADDGISERIDTIASEINEQLDIIRERIK